MVLPDHTRPLGSRRFLPTPPFAHSKALARAYGCDLSVPNGDGAGIGNVLAFTPLVEALALARGRPVRLLTSALAPPIGLVAGEDEHPIWLNNPYVAGITDLADFGERGEADMAAINLEQDNCCQFAHVIENVCFQYGVRPRAVRPQIFLTKAEQTWALDRMAHLPRPVVVVHPGGTSAPRPPDPWGRQRWRGLLRAATGWASFVQIGRRDADEPDLDLFRPETTLRQMFALLWAGDAFIGFDSSPMHVATAFGKPVLALWHAERKLAAEETCQVGFGPAVMLRWGYAQNRNVMILGEREGELENVVLTWLRQVLSPLLTPYFTASTTGTPSTAST